MNDLAKQWAEKLNGRQCDSEVTREEVAELKRNGLVIVFGASDDLVEFRGAIYGEIDCYNGGVAYIEPTTSDLFESECKDPDCPYAELIMSHCMKIEAVWCKDESPPWTYETDIPHETFDIYEDGEPYCRGIVFSVNDLRCNDE